MNQISQNKSTERHIYGEYKLCQKYGEMIDHIVSACPILAEEQWIQRHDRLCAELHLHMQGNLG